MQEPSHSWCCCGRILASRLSSTGKSQDWSELSKILITASCSKPAFPFTHPPDNEAALQLGVRLRNYTDGPLRFRVEQFEMNIEESALPHRQGIDSFIPRGGTRVYKMAPFTQSDLKGYQNRKVISEIKLSIAYGHPDRQPVRRLKTMLELRLDLTQSGSLGCADSILEERDEAIEI